MLLWDKSSLKSKEERNPISDNWCRFFRVDLFVYIAKEYHWLRNVRTNHKLASAQGRLPNTLPNTSTYATIDCTNARFEQAISLTLFSIKFVTWLNKKRYGQIRIWIPCFPKFQSPEILSFTILNLQTFYLQRTRAWSYTVGIVSTNLQLVTDFDGKSTAFPH